MKTICVNDVTEERTEQVLNDVIRQGQISYLRWHRR